MELNFDTLTKILTKETNEKLTNFIEYIDCVCDSYSLRNIVREFDKYIEYSGTIYRDLITSLSKDLKDYDVSYDDEDDLTDDGYDFLILYTQNKILTEHRREYNKAVFGQESGFINF